MPTPSLLIVPSRWKTGNPGKLYSQIPTNGNGDFNVTGVVTGGTSIGTRVNNLGYIEPITTSGTPRLDYYTSSGTPGCPALLVEPSGTNLCLQSENFGTTWAPLNITVTTGSTAAFTAPDGTTNADLLTSTSSISASSLTQTITVASGTSSISVFAKAGNYGLFRIANVSSAARAAWFNLDAGVVTGTVNGGSASMQNYGNGWYRCIFTPTTTVSGSDAFIIGISNAPNGTSGVSGSSIYFWGAQLETGSVATSYIPTTTGSVTRNADSISVTGVAGLIGQTEGTIYVDLSEASTIDNPLITVDDGTNNNRIVLFRQVSTGNWSIFTASAGAGGITSSSVSNNFGKFAIAYSSSGYSVYRDGVEILTRVAALPLSLNTIRLNGRATLDQFSTKRILAFALYTTRLTNAELMLLTMPGNNTYLPQAVWDNYLSRPGNTEVPDCLYTRHADLLDV